MALLAGMVPAMAGSGGADAGAAADAAGAQARPHWRKNFFKRMVTDQKYLVTRWVPAQVKQPSFFIPLLAATAVATRSDEEGIDFHLQKNMDRQEQNDDIEFFFSDLGNFQLAFVAGSYLTARWAHNDRLARASSLAGEAYLNALFWNDVLKEVTRRTRPTGGGKGEFFVANPEPGQQNTSFPSGHAMNSFAVAAVFAWEYRDKRWVPWLAYGTAGLIGWSRIAQGKHFPTDVIVGAVLGHSLGRMVVSREEGFLPRRWDRIQATYDPGNRAYGLAYHYSW